MRYDGSNNQELLDYVDSHGLSADRNARIVEVDGHSGVIFNNVGAPGAIATVFYPSEVTFDEQKRYFVIEPVVSA